MIEVIPPPEWIFIHSLYTYLLSSLFQRLFRDCITIMSLNFIIYKSPRLGEVRIPTLPGSEVKLEKHYRWESSLELLEHSSPHLVFQILAPSHPTYWFKIILIWGKGWSSPRRCSYIWTSHLKNRVWQEIDVRACCTSATVIAQN